MNYKLLATKEFPNTRPKQVTRVCDFFDDIYTQPNSDDEVSWFLINHFSWLRYQRAVEYKKSVHFITFTDKRNGEPVCEVCKELCKFKNLINENDTYATDEELADEKSVIEVIKSFGYKEIDKKCLYAKYKRK